MPAVYVHLSGKDLDEKLLSIYSGKEAKPPVPEFMQLICVRCKTKSSPGTQYCPKCGTPLDEKEIARSYSEAAGIMEELRKYKDLLERALHEVSRSCTTP